MNNESASSHISGEMESIGVNDAAHTRRFVPWVTLLAVAACTVIFLGTTSVKNDASSNFLTRFGYQSSQAIRSGAYWGLITNVFVHVEVWHFAFNAYWLWVFGTRLERAIGSFRFLLFFLLSAFVSSSFELAISDDGGIGMSGVGYAMFGFMWPTRHKFPVFKEVLTPNVIALFLVWLVGCVVATYANVMRIGNGAHIAGMLFGGSVAAYFVLRYRPKLMMAAQAALLAFSILILVWCPWSVMWLSIKAYDNHAAAHYGEALKFYSRIIQIDPKNAWAHYNRGSVEDSLGNRAKAEQDYAIAHSLDPTFEMPR